MPDAVTSAQQDIKPNTNRHRSKESLVSFRGCISIYVHRGYISSHPQKRRPADPTTQVLQKSLSGIAESKKRRFKTNFESFEPLHTKHGNVCEFHSRNVSTADFAIAMVQALPKAETGSTTAASDRSATLDPSVARRSQGLRGLPKRNYSVKKYYRKMEFPWNGEDRDDEEVLQQEQQQETETEVEDVPNVQQRGRKRRANQLLQESDEDDDEGIVVHTPRKSTKLEHLPEQAVPLETIEDRQSVVAGADIVPNGIDADAASRRRRKLEMEIQAIDLARRKNALEMKAVDLDQKAHRAQYELDKLG